MASSVAILGSVHSRNEESPGPAAEAEGPGLLTRELETQSQTALSVTE